MAPVALTAANASPPPLPAKKAYAAAQLNAGLNLDADGASTPYSATSTAVSEYDGAKDKVSHPASPSAIAKALVESTIPSTLPSPTDDGYYANLIASSLPTVATKPGATVFASAVDALEALAVKHSESVWVYDDAALVEFGARVSKSGSKKVHELQTRQGAGLELAGYASKTQGKFTIFASIKTLQYLLPSIDKIEGDVLINLATTANHESLEFTDGLYASGTLKALASLPEDWEVVFSSGDKIIDTASKLYAGEPRKVIHVVESTYSGRETAAYTFPAPQPAAIEDLTIQNGSATQLYLAPAGYLASGIAAVLPASAGLVQLNTLSPSSDALFAALTTEGGRKTVQVLGATKADAEALKAVVLASLYAASGSSKSVLPLVKSLVAASVAAIPDLTTEQVAKPGKVVSFFTAPTSPLPQLLAHLFLSSPSLSTRLAQFGSASARGVRSVLSLAPASTPAAALSVEEPSDVTWLSDANVLKSADVLASAKQGSIVVVALPWSEEELPVKFTRSEIQTIQSKQLRVFLLDLAAAPTTPIQEQVAFLLLYTGTSKLSQGVWKVLDAFHNHQVAREDVEAAQAALFEVNAASWEIPELEEGKTEKVKSQWEWDALPGLAGVVASSDEQGSGMGPWDLAARHLFFREAFAVPSAKTTDNAQGLPGVSALRPSMSEETFLVTVSENRRLTPQTYDRNVFHLELDTAGTGLHYDVGEAIGIHGWNDAEEVREFCEMYGVDPDSLVTFPSPTRAGTLESRTVFQLLQQNVDLFGRPGKAFYAALAKVATNKSEAMRLKFISAPEGAELFKRMAEKETVTFADVLKGFKTARPTIEELVGLIPEIKPRHYSIASSQKAVGDKVELLIVTVDWVDVHGSPRFGQCTRYLSALAPGSKVTVSIKPSVMKLPPDDKQPIIMAGLGTGAAPFRAFMQHRAWQRTQGIEVGPLIYYFGSRYRSQEYLYGEDIEAYIASGVIAHAGLAFSRDGVDKSYIQHKMSADKALLSKLLKGKGSDAAYFYLCGPTWPVPDVYEALVGSLTSEGGMERKAAEDYIEELKEEERYVLEVY
ncbi:sulfite reductase (NADPH) flavoprotein alpha-component [Cryptococcus wingfieldii CBS 7118]|uniref:assimilatory sulfite reductase (NADPH) n=1 Tax=Cryptococcus wingfieldii CBS 7118 TaxID=1295528 RepID=A0A1E3J4M7_9TREE|nr:sulfite reductase (NADPH) flavoprotein alpha-component [Cryptococcus wingfieldii CBS 7118]ODN95802.1 sulfite reductase (NADPH) flavoprotein alpha-component [Cryptococcus wingfieldii CBS 7118]